MFSPKIHRIAYIAFLTILGGCMVCSSGVATGAIIALGVNWLFEGRWREKWQMILQGRLLHGITVLMLMLLVGLLWSDNIEQGWRFVNILLPFFVVSLIILTSPPIEGKAKRIVLFFYTTTVIVVSIIGFIRWLTIPDLPYREIVHYSNIRFALSCCMVVIILCLQIARKFSPIKVLEILWILFFLFILRSYTAFILLTIVTLAVIIRYRTYARLSPLPVSLFRLSLSIWIVVVGSVALMIGIGCHSYYKLSPLAAQPLQSVTANGRPYQHLQDGCIENGNYVNNYICHEELATQWPLRSGMDTSDVTPTGYPVKYPLIRYLNALGLTKDSAGIAALTDEQVGEICRGIENPVYEHGSQPKKMLYVALFEFENYRHYHAVEGFTMLQRIELWKCSWRVFRHHLWFGTGTGDIRDEMQKQLQTDNSPLVDSKLLPHNQYLTYLTMFGIVGFAIILFFFIRAGTQAACLRQFNNPLFFSWVLIVLLSFLTENTLGNFAGTIFCSWFLAFRSPNPPTGS